MNDTNRRRFVRVRKRLVIEYTTDAPTMAEISDLGQGGAFIVTPDALPLGTRLRYKFRLPDGSVEIEGEAKVVRTEPKVGMAVEFRGLSQEDEERVGFLVGAQDDEPLLGS